MTTHRAPNAETESGWRHAWRRARPLLWAFVALLLIGQLASCVVPYRRRVYGYGYYAPTYVGPAYYDPYRYDAYGYDYGYYPYRNYYSAPYRDRVYVAPPRGVIVNPPAYPRTPSGVIVDPPGVRSTPSGPVQVPARGPVYVTPPR